ncbi:glycosyltransferase family 4 protein [Perlabentimonas gracilis]|uniref:glycosyltransferase family 4 protein n=1 Tax=Perlabentimonas gracilis TaxID=2715279 RepID=UPI00140AA6D3|nr:glycosyltransferase family 4 protein [Perlabentimonas gracilis]NHB67653.1 glycosyltransferase family 4 protein [Perlabentimonas gracilis]
MPKRLLILTYYWPPSGGSGVQRWLKFAKYLREFGWEPVIYTPQNPEVAMVDETLNTDIPQGVEVLKRNIFEPYMVFRLFTRQKGKMGVGFTSYEGSAKGVVGRLALWVRANLFIPDARMFWVKPSVRFLTKYLIQHPVDAVVSTGPPHSMHLIARGLKQKLGIKWMADFRDPWTNIDYFIDLPLAARALKKHRRLEHDVLVSADEVVVVGSQMQNEFEQTSSRKVHIITNGYDETDFPTQLASPDAQFTITHVGTIPPNRNSELLWQALSHLVNSNNDIAKQLKIQLLGNVDKLVIDQISQYNLTPYCQQLGYLSHAQSVQLMQRSQILLLLVNNSPNAKGILTGKVFEYLAARRPILAIGPLDGDVDNLLKETKAGVTANFSNYDDILNNLTWLWDDYVQGFPSLQNIDATAYSRRNLTGRLVEILDNLS